MRTFHLALKSVARSIGDHVIFSGLDLTVSPGDRIGIVGPNGIGKSTLLRLLVGTDQPDRGEVVRQPGSLVVGHVAQEPVRGEATVRSVLRARSGVTAAEDEFLASTEALTDETPESAERYDRALDRYLRLDVAGFDIRLADVVAETGLAERLLDTPLSVLSGGEAARVSLASVLLQRADVLCLDEPTNDLDHAGLALLTSFISRFDGAVVLISHDRAFLDDVITDVLELQEPDGRAQRFSGGWSAYLEERATVRRHAEEAYAVNQTQRSELQSRARQQREWATKGVASAKNAATDNDKMQRDFRINRTEKLASKARATEQALDRLGTVEKPWEGWQLQFEINEHGRSGDLVASFDAAVVERGEFSLGPIDLTIGWGDRLAIVGPNGSGKSTLLRSLLGEIPLTSGRVRLGPGVVVGELRQGRAELFTGPTLLRAFADSTDLLDAEARSLLAKFGLGVNEVTRPPDQLSPGERTRAGLARFQAMGVNCLLLDEPTNHLDLPAIEQLEEALQRYGGTLVVVSHDRVFLDALELDSEVDLGRR